MMSFVLSAALALQLAAGGGSKPAREQGERAADPASKVICKRFLETGSLVSGYKICKTKADWEKGRDRLRQTNSTESCRLSGQGGAC